MGTLFGVRTTKRNVICKELDLTIQAMSGEVQKCEYLKLGVADR